MDFVCVDSGVKVSGKRGDEGYGIKCNVSDPKMHLN